MQASGWSVRCCRWPCSEAELVETRVPEDRPSLLEHAGDRARPREEREVAGLVVEQDRVEHVAGGDAAEAVGNAEELRTVARRGEQRLLDREPRGVQERDLRQVPSVQLAADEVAAEDDLDAVRARDLDGVPEPIPKC